MSTEPHDEANEDGEKPPADKDLQEPSTEKDPGEEPKKDAPPEPEASHEAIGIGVIGGELNDSMPD
ncbi:MAG: hypothetical protein ABWY55_03950 [Microbacterium sp.]